MRCVLIACLLAGCVGPGLFVETVGDGEGMVRSDPSGIECGDTCGMIMSGPVSLTAVPEYGSELAGWEGDCGGTDPACTVESVENVHVRARFVRVPHMLAVMPTANGGVVSMPAGIDCG